MPRKNFHYKVVTLTEVLVWKNHQNNHEKMLHNITSFPITDVHYAVQYIIGRFHSHCM